VTKTSQAHSILRLFLPTKRPTASSKCPLSSCNVFLASAPPVHVAVAAQTRGASHIYFGQKDSQAQLILCLFPSNKLTYSIFEMPSVILWCSQPRNTSPSPPKLEVLPKFTCTQNPVRLTHFFVFSFQPKDLQHLRDTLFRPVTSVWRPHLRYTAPSPPILEVLPKFTCTQNPVRLTHLFFFEPTDLQRLRDACWESGFRGPCPSFVVPCLYLSALPFN
jgi:hypothetical protein